MGRSPQSDRIRTRVLQTSGSRAGRRAKPEPNRDGGLRSADEQPQVGQSSRQCDALARLTGLPKDSVANVSQVVSLDKAMLTDRTGRLPRAQLGLVLSGIDVVLGR